MSSIERLDRYRVGSCVRDRLLGLEPNDCDWVVVGAVPQVMLELGFIQVGKEYPVFLHPETREEHALARTEREVSPGCQGFKVDTSKTVTIEEDLARRDLTINAIAMDQDGNLIDPFGGVDDLDAGVLRHVSEAFVEDPVRILRIARFAARYGFEVAPETLDLMCRMVVAGEVDTLMPERVWLEIHKALAEMRPSEFFRILHACGALERLLPELAVLDGVPQPERHHPEVDTFVHVLMALDQATRLTTDPVIRFAVLMHDLGKGVTPEDEWPRHIGHEEAGVHLVNEVADRHRIPDEYRRLAQLTSAHHLRAHRALEMKPAKLVRLFNDLDAFRHPEMFEQFIVACEADVRGRLGLEDRAYPQADYLREAFSVAAVNTVCPEDS